MPGENALLELSEAMKPAWQALSAAAQNVDVLVTPHKPGAAPPPAPLAITAMLPAVEAYFALADALAPDQLEEVSKKMAEKQQERKEPASTGNGQELIIPGTVAPNTSANNTPIKMSQPSRASTPGLLRASSVKFTSKLGLDALLENTTVADELKSRLSTEAWKFAERHRSVINALLRRNPQLLTTSLKTLLRTPALVDFDVKRAHIQLKLKKEKEKYVSGHIKTQNSQITPSRRFIQSTASANRRRGKRSHANRICRRRRGRCRRFDERMVSNPRSRDLQSQLGSVPTRSEW